MDITKIYSPSEIRPVSFREVEVATLIVADLLVLWAFVNLLTV